MERLSKILKIVAVSGCSGLFFSPFEGLEWLVFVGLSISTLCLLAHIFIVWPTRTWNAKLPAKTPHCAADIFMSPEDIPEEMLYAGLDGLMGDMHDF